MENESNLENMARIYQLDYENKTCVDCKKAFPKFVSINNGVVICHACAEMHSALGVNISYVRNLNDQWDEYLLSFMLRGGNGRFIRMLREYEIPEDSDIGYKYRTKAAENYRKIIKSEVLADEPPEGIPTIAGREVSDCEYSLNPEFENYSFLKAEQVQIEDSSNEKQGIFKFMGRIFYQVGSAVGNAAIYLKDKIKDMELGDKMKTSSVKAYGVMKVAGKFVILKSEPVMEKLKEKTIECFEILSDKTTKGASYVKARAVEYYTDLKGKMASPGIDSSEPKIIYPESIIKDISTVSPSDLIEVDPRMTEYINQKAIPDKNCYLAMNITVKPNNSFTLLGSSSELEINRHNEPNSELPTYEDIMKQKEEFDKIKDINK